VSGLADPGHMAGDRVSPAATAPTPEAEPGRSHLQPAELVHAHVYAQIFADGVREWSRGSTDVLAQRANVTASLAAKFYKPWTES
jgi:hypothetical protein